MIGRKASIVITILLLLSSMGCVAQDHPDLSAGKIETDLPVELTIWLWPGTGLETFIQQYAKENPGIKVHVQTAQFEDVHNNLQTAFAAGIGAPDISIIEVSFIDRFKTFPDYFYNLAKFGAGKLEGSFLDWKWQQALSLDGQFILGLPTDIGPLAMIYHKELFRKADLPTDREQVAQQLATWDDLLEAGVQVREKTGKAMFDNLSILYRSIISQAERKYFDKAGRLIVDTNPSVDKAWNYAVKAAQLNLTARIPSYVPEWGQGVSNGEFAVMLSPAWMMGFIKSSAPDAAGNWDITYLPGGSGNWGGSFLTIPGESKHPEEAYKLIQWLTAPEQQLKNFYNNGNFPSTPDVYDNPLISGKQDEYFSGAYAGKIYSEAAKNVKPVYEGAHAHFVSAMIDEALLKLEKNTTTPEQAWNEAMIEITRELNLNP
jgi:cellobiose transport system substrate-binding protein